MEKLPKDEYRALVRERMKALYRKMLDGASDETVKEMIEDGLRFCRFDTMTLLLWSVDTRIGLQKDTWVKMALPALAKNRKMPTDVKMTFVRALETMSRWDLVVKIIAEEPDPRFRTWIFSDIRRCIDKGIVACARCMPRDGRVANRIRGFMKLTPKQWRHKLAPLCTNQVATILSQKRWTDLSYETIPVHLHAFYYKAFMKHDGERYKQFLDANVTTKKRILWLRKKPARRDPKSFDEVIRMEYFKRDRQSPAVSKGEKRS